jgi:hypothetical protein
VALRRRDAELRSRYDYYTRCRGQNNCIVKFNIDTGAIDPEHDAGYTSKKNNCQPRVRSTYAPARWGSDRRWHLRRPGQTEDQIQPVESDRISSTLSSGALPRRSDVLVATSSTTRTTGRYQPRAYANEYYDSRTFYQYNRVSAARASGASCPLPPRMSAARDAICFLRSVANRSRRS